MKRLAKRAVLSTPMVGVVAGLAFLAFLLAGAWGDGAGAEPEVTVGVDVDIDDNDDGTPDNSATSLGSIDACIEIDTTEVTEFDIDIYVTDVPPLRGFDVTFNYDGDVLNVTGRDVFQFLDSGSGSNVLDLSDIGLPDIDGFYRAGAFDTSGNHESGSGVLVRLSLEAVGSGVSPAELTYVSLWDPNGDSMPPLDDHGHFAGPIFNGQIAVDEECPDTDDDGIPDAVDNCPLAYNPYQEDGDGDDRGDACDNCWAEPNWDQSDVDDDCPTVPPPYSADPKCGDLCDNCPEDPNTDQANHDTDPYGDACDVDDDNDGYKDDIENYLGSDPLDPNSLVEVCNGLDNDGDGRFDEDPVDGVDNDYDCPGDTNGDTVRCGPGDDGVDEDPLDATGTDDDGDTLVNEGYDYDGDTAIDEDWDVNGNTIPDCLDPAVDTDEDTAANPSDSDDDDDGDPDAGFNDGFADWRENWMGTDSLDACSDDVNDQAWPPDFNNDTVTNVLDIMRYRHVIGTAYGSGTNPEGRYYDRRFDLNADKAINVLDVMKMRPHFWVAVCQ